MHNARPTGKNNKPVNIELTALSIEVRTIDLFEGKMPLRSRLPSTIFEMIEHIKNAAAIRT